MWEKTTTSNLNLKGMISKSSWQNLYDVLQPIRPFSNDVAFMTVDEDTVVMNVIPDKETYVTEKILQKKSELHEYMMKNNAASQKNNAASQKRFQFFRDKDQHDLIVFSECGEQPSTKFHDVNMGRTIVKVDGVSNLLFMDVRGD